MEAFNAFITQLAPIILAVSTLVGTVYGINRVKANEKKTERIDNILTEGADDPESVKTLLEVIDGLRTELRESNKRNAQAHLRNLDRIGELERVEDRQRKEIRRLNLLIMALEKRLDASGS